MSFISPTPSLNGIIEKFPLGASFSTSTSATTTTTTSSSDGTSEKTPSGENKTLDQGETLFTPIRIGDIQLDHRIVMCPLTRHRASQQGVHGELGKTYYGQRATKGGLIITEGTIVSQEAGGEANVPGIYSDEQVEAWKEITKNVHDKEGKIVCQLWSLGRVADPSLVEKVYSPNNIPYMSTERGPHMPALTVMTEDDIKRFVNSYKEAARNAVRAGFDGVEIHAANGYLIDQFLQTNSNTREDSYGGSLLDRSRFLFQIIESVISVIEENKVGIRLSPYSTFQGMRMINPLETFLPLLEGIMNKHPNLAYIHVIEGDQSGDDTKELRQVVMSKGNGTGYISAGGYQVDQARKVVNQHGGMIGFGRYFISNPDLPARIQSDLPLSEWDESTFYTNSAEGYIE
ncbi:uncharacterized protein IL334_007933 [Kwoniella shivajii]|uniref:NADH:flavin oxidoreductase/NADH oxidase N-terminal domain-containing protein n=1 Tax=Kwoniella shivajii TaxID=564305 RepID=A0ABZ1DBW1_9TREE|nr:hypothetical protein IL334_007933 [Kwoniella shivajii]